MTLSPKRAALVAALSLFAMPLFAQTKAPKSETYKDIIEKAYNLSLQKDRQQALIIISNAIQKESRPQAVAELKKTASELGHLFLSDKAQQLFESGVALRKADLNQAQDKISEALRIESDNLSIVGEMARIYIAKGDCRSAQELANKNIKVIGFDEDLKLALAQSYACQQRWSDYQRLAEPALIKRSPFLKFWLALEVEKHLSGKNYVKAQESLNILRKSDDKYPTTAYLAWKLALLQRKRNAEEAHKYLMTCKNISANQYRQYMIDPMLCRHLIEVEKEQKGTNGTPE